MFAGRVGLGVADLLQQLDNSRWLNGRIRLIREPGDAEISALYQGCLFTILPSLFEGYGLPLGESLALGKPCLAASGTALPEAGGDLCRYFDPEDVGDAHRAIAALLDDPGCGRRLGGRHPRALPAARLVRRRDRHHGPRSVTIWFDVEDLVHYFGSGNKRISGIQRLSFEIFRAAKALEGEGTAIGFVRHGVEPTALIPVAWADLLADFGGDGPASRPRALPDAGGLDAAGDRSTSERPRSLPRRLARRVADRMPPEVRRPLVLAAVMQVQVFGALARFGAGLALYPVRRAATGSRRLALSAGGNGGTNPRR